MMRPIVRTQTSHFDGLPNEIGEIIQELMSQVVARMPNFIAHIPFNHRFTAQGVRYASSLPQALSNYDSDYAIRIMQAIDPTEPFVEVGITVADIYWTYAPGHFSPEQLTDADVSYYEIDTEANEE